MLPPMLFLYRSMKTLVQVSARNFNSILITQVQGTRELAYNLLTIKRLNGPLKNFENTANFHEIENDSFDLFLQSRYCLVHFSKYLQEFLWHTLIPTNVCGIYVDLFVF